MMGWTRDGKEVTLLPHQEDTVKALLAEYETTLYFGRLGWGRSTIIATVSRYEREYVQYDLPLPWPRLSKNDAHAAAARVRAVARRQNPYISEST